MSTDFLGYALHLSPYFCNGRYALKWYIMRFDYFLFKAATRLLNLHPAVATTPHSIFSLLNIYSGDVEFLDVWDDSYAAIMRWSRAPDGFWVRSRAILAFNKSNPNPSIGP